MAKKRKETPYGVRVARSKYSQINGNSRSRKNAFNDIKESLNFSDLCVSMDYIEKNIPLNNELIYGNPLPNDYSNLGELKEHPFLGDKIQSELNQTLLGVRKFKYEINKFLEYKNQFETNLLIGNYKLAEETLTKIENEICFSLWSLENRFVLMELSGKASENKKFLGSFNEKSQAHGITKALAHYLSLRAEHSLSINRYFNDIEIALNNMKGSTKEASKSYYRFRLTFLNHIDFTHYAEIISIDFNHSIIDRYLNIIRVLTNLLAVSNYLDDDVRLSTIKSYLKNRINYLIRKIDDPILYKLKLFSNERIFPAFDVAKSLDEIRVIDHYTSGSYELAEKELSKLLLKKPEQFDLYVLYVKSLVYQKKEFKFVGNPKSVQNEILSDLYKITSVSSNPDKAGMNLLRLANNLTSTTLSYGITEFVFRRKKDGQKERKLLSRLSYNIANPIIHEVYSDNEGKSKFLNLLESRFPHSLTIDFFQKKLLGIDELKEYENKIPEDKFKIELARKLQEKKDYIGAVEEWEFLISNYKDTIPILETSIVNLFYCYLKLNRPNSCIELLVDSFFQNNYLVEKIETRELLELISSNRFRDIDRTINLPILYTIVDADDVEAHISFELFNQSVGVEKPSEILNTEHNLDEEKLMFYLEHTCSPKVLMHSTYIENSKERLEERLALTNFIKSKMPENKSIEAEIKSIQNILVIQQGLIDLDESKIYVNEEGIIESELQEYKAVFDRFTVIAGITGENKLLYLKGGELIALKSKEDTEDDIIEYSSNPVFEIYFELFEAIKDKFLNSQFGIVAYLSTRIRHGVLIGELRPIFEKHNLITLKEGSTSNYRRNYHWDSVYKNLTHDEREQIQILLSDFSSKIDGLIFDLIKKHLQVYNQDTNDEGWFNYEFDQNSLWYHSLVAIYSDSFEGFVQQVFDVLWERTDKNLTKIRSKIQNEILIQFNTYFNDLEMNLMELFDSQSNQIIKSIKDCSTEFQTAMNKISRWFKRSEIKASDFKLSELVSIIKEHTNKSSLYKTLVLETDFGYNPSIKGGYKTHFADLFRIFLENIIKHSGENVSNLNCFTSTVLERDSLIVTIENEITNKESIEALANTWKGNQLDIQKLLSENKSGYHKAYKILTSDLKCSEVECLTTGVSENEDKFRVTFSINTNNILS